jgi:hypothetical protein
MLLRPVTASAALIIAALMVFTPGLASAHQGTSSSTTPFVVPATCPIAPTRTVQVRTATQLTHALPGDAIELADGTYAGHFVIARSGTAAAPITLCGSRRAILDGGGITTGYGLALRADHWIVSGFAITDVGVGIMADRANDNVLRGLEVYGIGGEGVHFRTFSSHNTLQASFIHDTGLYVAHDGEGVYVGSAAVNWATYTGGLPDRSDANQIIGNTIGPNTTAESVDLKEGTTGGLVSANVFNGTGMTAADSWIDAKGNGYRIAGNTGSVAPTDGFQTHIQVAGWGNDNTFQGNVADVQASGYGFRIKAGSSGNVVACDNVVSHAVQGFANIPCR